MPCHFYLDASALAKRYVPEPGTSVVNHLFATTSSDRFNVLNIGLAEVISILKRKNNSVSISLAMYAQALTDFRSEIINQPAVFKIIPETSLVLSSFTLIDKHSINATDAILLRSAIDLANGLRTDNDDLVLVASDHRLLRAAQMEGLLTFNPETQTTADLDLLLV